IVQLRSGAVGFNAFLKKIEQSTNTLCRQYRGLETVNHFLFFCRRYREQRQKLKRSLGHNAHTAREVLGNPKKSNSPVRYALTTNRFQH
ncbi:hypothetical protein B0H21DRAFT_834903, partial [Amylocystis lapponica]